MKRTAIAGLLLALLGGCVTTDHGHPWGRDGDSGSAGCTSCGSGGVATAPTVPGMQGAWGQPVAMAAPYSATPPNGEAAARSMMARSMPMDLVQASGMVNPASGSSIIQAGGHGGSCGPNGCGGISPPGVPFNPGMPGGGSPAVPGMVAAYGALSGGPAASRFPTRRTEVRFAGPASMKVSWFAPSAEGKNGFSGNQLEAPGRYNFVQAAVYRLKLSDIPNRPGLELYPTLEVVPSNARTDPFLAHSAVPIVFTEEDFDQVVAGNFLVKVIYLPNPHFQDLATTGPDEIVSSRLEPGADPVAEAYKRGNILLVVRMGNIDLEAPNTPAMDAPSPYMLKAAAPPAGQMPGMPGMPGMPNMAGPGGQMPGMPGMPNMAGPGGMGQPNAMAGGNGMIMTPYGPMMMTPNGPVLMTPNGPVPVGPNGPIMNPGAAAAGANSASPQAPGMLPPASGVPGTPTSLPGAAPTTGTPGPVSRLPDLPVSQTRFAASQAAAAREAGLSVTEEAMKQGSR